MDVREQVGRNVRRLRHQAGLSLEELAFRAEVNRGYLNGIERYVRNPTVTLLQKIAGALGVTIADLVAEPKATAGGPAALTGSPGSPAS